MYQGRSFLWGSIWCLILICSCSQWQTKKVKPLEAAKAPPTPLPEAVESNRISRADEIEQLTVGDVIDHKEPNATNNYDDSRYDFPITINARVDGWIDYFSGRGRRHFLRYMRRSSRYLPMMKHIFRKEGLPEDLVYLAMIESGFNVRARSHAGAVGPWQFIRGTGRRYGLQIDTWIDERRDPIKSTIAAANYLKDLYLMFESWYLAAAAYNAGENKILRAMGRLKTNNFWRIAKTRYIRRETKDYVPKIMAAAIIAKNPERYGISNLEYQQPLSFELVEVNYSLRVEDIAKMLRADEQELLDLNPELYRGIIPPKSTQYQLRVPEGTGLLVEKALVARMDQLSKPVQPIVYRIRRGDSLGRIARKFRVSLPDLLSVNNIRRRHRIYPGRSLVIPLYGQKPRRIARSKSTFAAAKRRGGFVVHTVRRGETLWSISVKYNVTIQQLFNWNRLRSSKIRVGRKLKVRPKSKEARRKAKLKARSS